MATQGPPNVMVVVSPKPGKEDRVAEAIARVSGEVKAHEPWISLYRWYRVRELGREQQGENDGVTEYYIVFRTEDLSKLSTRREMPHHQEIARLIRDEDLLKTPLKYLTLEDQGVWTR